MLVKLHNERKQRTVFLPLFACFVSMTCVLSTVFVLKYIFFPLIHACPFWPWVRFGGVLMYLNTDIITTKMRKTGYFFI